MSFADENMFDVNITAGISVMQINRFLGEGDDSDGMVPSSLTTFEFGLHMGERPDVDPEDSADSSTGPGPGSGPSGDVTVCGICSAAEEVPQNRAILSVDEIIGSILECHPAQPFEEAENRFEAMLSKSFLLKLSRRAFYEGQVRGLAGYTRTAI